MALLLELKTYKYKINRASPFDTLAQLVELGASNAKVPGSNPGWSVIFFFFFCHLTCVVE